MSLSAVLRQYQDLSTEAKDSLGTPVLSRLKDFREILESYFHLASVKATKRQLKISELAFFTLIYGSTKVSFENEAEIERRKVSLFFSRLFAITVGEISLTGADFYGDLLENDRASKAIVQAVITESSRRARVAQAFSQNKRLNLISHYRLFAALKLNQWDFELHDKLLSKPLSDTPALGPSVCQIDSCSSVSAAVIVCPELDGQEYICQAHKSDISTSFTVYRYVFSRSCGHSPDVSKCKFEVILNGAMAIPIAKYFGKDRRGQRQRDTRCVQLP